MRESETSFFFRYRKSYELFVTCKCHVGYIKVTVWGDLDPQLGNRTPHIGHGVGRYWCVYFEVTNGRFCAIAVDELYEMGIIRA